MIIASALISRALARSISAYAAASSTSRTSRSRLRAATSSGREEPARTMAAIKADSPAFGASPPVDKPDLSHPAAVGRLVRCGWRQSIPSKR